MDGDGPRIGQLEREMSSLVTRVEANERSIGSLLPLSTALVRLEGGIEVVKEDVHEIREQSRARGEQERSLRIALVGLSGTILVTLIGSIVTLLATGAHP